MAQWMSADFMFFACSFCSFVSFHFIIARDPVGTGLLRFGRVRHQVQSRQNLCGLCPTVFADSKRFQKNQKKRIQTLVWSQKTIRERKQKKKQR
jgi:hypothetical protein